MAGGQTQGLTKHRWCKVDWPRPSQASIASGFAAVALSSAQKHASWKGHEQEATAAAKASMPASCSDQGGSGGTEEQRPGREEHYRQCLHKVNTAVEPPTEAVALSRTRPADFGGQPQVPSTETKVTSLHKFQFRRGLDSETQGEDKPMVTNAYDSMTVKGVDDSAKSGGSSPAAEKDARGTAAKTKDLLAGIQRWRRESQANFQTVGDPIGNGSYGQVTRVRHKDTGEIFAMKAVPKQKIRDQGIVQLHYYFEDEHHVLLLLEYANGGSLFSLLRQHGQLPEAEAARYYVDVALALMHLHKHGIASWHVQGKTVHLVHRDLKPENILMCGDPPTKAKLADFGWCAELEKGGAPRNTFCLSPEVENQPHNNKVDIWATGVLLFEMLTGRAPFSAPRHPAGRCNTSGHSRDREQEGQERELEGGPAKATDRIRKVDLQVPGYVPPLAADLMQKLLVREPAMRIGLSDRGWAFNDALKHNWIALQVPGTSLELTKVVQPLAPLAATKEVTVDRGPGPSSAYAEAVIVMLSTGTAREQPEHGIASVDSLSGTRWSSASRSDNTPTSIKEASELGTPAEAKRALDFGLPDTKERGDAFHLSQADQLGFGSLGFLRSAFAVVPEARNSYLQHLYTAADVNMSTCRWSESETFAAVRDWLKSPTAIVARLQSIYSSGVRFEDSKELNCTEADERTRPTIWGSTPGWSHPSEAEAEDGLADCLETGLRTTGQAASAAGAANGKGAKTESVDDVTKCHNALDSLQERLQRKWEAMVAG
ncbi:Serine/threonine-protein kinase ark1 [Symbiodinium microadriaticum]|uniref:Serine/threonine-protein kinase ark1 n=1 Tax=Symbiodinium microadriaticum TaxID=2951 RepID=A0A1Q9EQ27_SYMMI|nr:Serine/threonine-protein kinase ark1 [Symbiodinium microadriaticum]